MRISSYEKKEPYHIYGGDCLYLFAIRYLTLLAQLTFSIRPMYRDKFFSLFDGIKDLIFHNDCVTPDNLAILIV